MKKIVIFGAGGIGRILCKKILNTNNMVVAFIDNNPNLHSIEIEGCHFNVKRATSLKQLDFDVIIISVCDKNDICSIKDQIKNELGNEKKIIVLVEEEYYSEFAVELCDSYDEINDKRVSFLRNFAKFCYESNIQGNVAECGVFLGGFSEYINKYFNDRKLYMFDTFEGFDEKDLNIENKLGIITISDKKDNCFVSSNYTINAVLNRMKYPDKCEIRKGWFPETANDIIDSFCFVNLDMDLYKPMYEGLMFFYDKMTTGGVILLHDYYGGYLGVKKAVSDFENDNNITLVKLPIGDGCSMAVIKV